MIASPQTAEVDWIEYQRPYLYPLQENIFFGPHRYGYCEASSKAGKTHACIIWIVEKALLEGFAGWNGWWVAPVTAQAKIAMARIKTSVPKSFLKVNETDKWVEFPNGARIWFKSAEKPDNLYGEDVYAAVFDEASRSRYDSWKALRSTLTATRGQIRLIANVKGKANWFYLECRKVEREMGENGRKFARITIWDAVDAGVIERAEADELKATRPAAEFRELYEAQGADDADAFLPSEYIEKANKRKNVQGFGALVIGADPSQGKGDPAAFAFRRGALIEKIEEHKEMDEFGFIGHIIRLCDVYKPARVNVDATGFGATVVKMIHQEHPALREIVKGFNMSGRSLYPDEYRNKRAEMYGEGRKALIDDADPMQLPDNEALTIELGCQRLVANTSGTIQLESKDDLAERGFDSPNMADAWALTFAEPIAFVNQADIKYPLQQRKRQLT